jgi:hypothetical protein
MDSHRPNPPQESAEEMLASLRLIDTERGGSWSLRGLEGHVRFLDDLKHPKTRQVSTSKNNSRTCDLKETTQICCPPI